MSTLHHMALLPREEIFRLVDIILRGNQPMGTGTTPSDIQGRLNFAMQHPSEIYNIEDVTILVNELRQRGVEISEEDYTRYKQLARNNGGRKSRVRKRRKTKRKRFI